MNEIALTHDEQADLAQLEAVIERGMNTFIEVGNALAVIQERKLYRSQHGTFEDYCRSKWGFSRQRAYQLTAAAEAVTTMVDIGLPAPTSERQARELSRIPEPERVEVWRETVNRTGGQPTAAAVRETYAARTEEVVEAEIVEEPAPRIYSVPPAPERAPDRQPRVDASRTVLVALTELRQTRESLEALTAAQLARQDEETRRIWAARLNTELEALHGFHNSLIKENNQ
ncbi:hypothetical protein AB0D42_27790 [Streptomyces sp. NPDC048304]|uniref:hypothetical protein n=1 Tax=Streptomyces sp. NPDC048304 TaxID=3154820 RepID=UPI00340D0E15